MSNNAMNRHHKTKKLGTGTKRKQDAWTNILKRCNEVNKKERGLTQLQFQWRNTKMRLEAKGNRYRVLVNATGGGPRPASPKGEDAEIMALIPKEFEVDFNIFDNDGLAQQLSVADSILPEDSELKSSPLKHETVSGLPSASTSRVSPTPALIPKKKSKTKYVQSNDEYYKKELFLIAKKVREKELEYMKEVHEAQMKSIAMEREFKMQEEHNEKIKIMNKKQ